VLLTSRRPVALHHADAVADQFAAAVAEKPASRFMAAWASSSERQIALKHYRRWII
jgi:hypothetical protein